MPDAFASPTFVSTDELARTTVHALSELLAVIDCPVAAAEAAWLIRCLLIYLGVQVRSMCSVA
jgi:hypothetical protein